MEITFLGTAAATSYPLAFCNCNFCSQARINGGKDFRKRSSIVVNNDLLIDFGPDTVSASFSYSKPLTNIRYLLQTHPHSDHFDASHLTTRIPEYLGVNTPPLQIYASEKTLIKMSEMMKNEGCVNNLFDQNEQERMNLRIFPISPFETFDMGNYKVTAFPTEHDSLIDSLIYSVKEENINILYATDTDTLTEDVWNEFHNKNMQFNIVILDHTYGPDTDSGGHLNANRFIETFKRMKKENLLAKNARVFATHLSHEGNPNHDELSKYANQNGYEIAYDGLVVEQV